MNKDDSQMVIFQFLLSTPRGRDSWRLLMGHSTRMQGGPFRMMDGNSRQDIIISLFWHGSFSEIYNYVLELLILKERERHCAYKKKSSSV